MHNHDFNRIIEEMVDHCKNTLVRKGDEYAGSATDRLHAFKVAAALQGVSSRQALGGMMAKHTASIYDWIDDDIAAHEMADWDEKIGDHINYLLILKTILEEEDKERMKSLRDLTNKLVGNPPNVPDPVIDSINNN